MAEPEPDRPAAWLMLCLSVAGILAIAGAVASAVWGRGRAAGVGQHNLYYQTEN
jgi:hypothetical protein